MSVMTQSCGLALPETRPHELNWRANSTLDDYSAVRPGYSDYRDYSYNPRGQLTNETFAPGAGQSVNVAYGFEYP